MPVLSFDDFRGGLDVRPAAALSKPNILRVLQNAYITTGKEIRKRPCLSLVATLEAGTVGLKSFNGKLNTFYGHGAAITHANPLFRANRTPHITTGAAPTKVHFCDQYNALMYVAVEHGDGTFRHHYLDDPGAWVALTNYTAGDVVRPTTANGFRYVVTIDAGSAGAGEPVWPTTIGATVVDGGLTWTCGTFAVGDVNCPHTKQVAKASQKIYAVGASNQTTVRYCKTGDPRNWTAVSDAGFIAAGLYSKGSDQVTAIGPFRKSGLAVLFSDNTQVWATDPNPANIALTDSIEGIGTIYHRATGPVSQDLFFHAKNGYRSVSLVAITNNLQDNDVGSPIDKLVTAATLATDDPMSLYYPKLGQFLEFNGTIAWAFSFSRTAKISAWSKFTYPFTIDDATVLNQELYVRAGNDVYLVSDAVYKDGVSSIPLVDIVMFYQDGKKPGVTKQFTGIKTIGKGQPTVSYLFAVENQTLESLAYELPAVGVAGQTHPVELLAERIAPHFTHQKDEEFELSSASLLYEDLGVV